MNLLSAAMAVFVLALAGVGGLRLCWPNISTIPRLARLALGYCAGTFLVAVIFFVAYLSGITFSRWLLLGPVAVLAVIGLWTIRPEGMAAGSSKEKPWLAGLLVLMALAISWGRPVHGYDAIMMWALKAKMAYFARTWPATMFEPFTTAHTEYPPLVPSAQAFVFFWLGEFDDVASRVVFAGWFAAGAVILWWLLGQLRAGSRTMWVMWWCAVPVALEQVNVTYADWPLAVYSLVFYGAVMAWLREPDRRDWLRLAGIFGGLAFLVKQDAMIGVGAGLVALVILAVIRKQPWRAVMTLVLIVAAIAAPWRAFVWVHNLPNDFAFAWAGIPLKTLAVAKSFFQYTIAEEGFAFFWPLLIVILLFRWRRLGDPEAAWLLISSLFVVGAIFAIYWFAKDDLRALLPTSMERVLINLFVPALLLGARLWRSRLAILRWEVGGFIVGMAAMASMFCLGYQQPVDEQKFTMIALLPTSISCVWVIAILLTTWRLWSVIKRHGQRAIWRTVQVAAAMATMGLALVVIGIHAGACGELWHEFGGKTLMQQHVMAVPPPMRRQISQALTIYPPGTHVNVLPKRSMWRHRFYYETYPDLIVDSLSTNLIRLSSQ